MRFALAPFGVALLSALSLSAYATTFVASGTFVDGSKLGGTLTIDTVNGSITSSNLIVTGASNFTFVSVVNQSNTQVPGDYNVGDRNAGSTEDFNFDLPVSTLVGYLGGAFCTNSALCLNGSRSSGLFNLTTQSGEGNLISGALSVPTPEPSNLLLLGTGVLGLAASAKRRFFSWS